MRHYTLKNYSPKGHVQEEVNNATSFMLGFDEWYGKCYRSGGGGREILESRERAPPSDYFREEETLK